MKSRTYRIIGGIITSLLILLCGHTICNAEWHFGEYMLYAVTLLCTVSFFGSVFPPKSERGQKTVSVFRKITGIVLTAYIVGFAFLLFACRTDKVTYKEKYSIVLGAPVREGRVSKILEKRVETATDFLKKDKDAVAVLTGGNSPYSDVNDVVAKVTTEGAYMTMALIDEGIAPERLYLENEATTTVENFQYSKDILKDAGYQDGDTVVIITNRFHSYRVRQLAKEAGFSNFRILAAPVIGGGAVTWYLREIPVSILFFIKHTLFGEGTT